MSSKVGICNSALIKLGASTIMSLTDGSKNANLCNEQYGKLRDELLRAHPWNFAIRRAKLAQLSAAPAFGFAHAYQLPADWLRTVSVHDNEAGTGAVRYRIEGRRILADAPDIYLRYVSVVDDPNDMPAAFQEALAWRIAADLAQAVTQSTTVQEAMLQGFRPALATAKSIDAIEDFPESQPQSGWVTVRY
jgi:hypothetical protein